jgi:DNA-binding NtrC family response regulator
MPHSDRPRVLVVDDQLELAEMFSDGLRDHGYEAVATGSGRAALELLRNSRVDALVTALTMPEPGGFALLRESRRLASARPVIVMAAAGETDAGLEAIRQGATHALMKPFKLAEGLVYLARGLEDALLKQEAAALRASLLERASIAGCVARSPAMRVVLETVERLAQTDTPVLLTGEIGTGKGLLALALHTRSSRAAHPFVTVSCASLPEQLLERELFGYVKGAFAGAIADRAGLFAEADGGTLVLDEIGELPLGLQAKVLRVLESHQVRQLGSSRDRCVNFRVVAATHQNLRERVRAGSFRSDLMFRLNVIPLQLPPLRERKEDLPLLVEQFLREMRDKHPESPVRRVSPSALDRLIHHAWYGNVRELSHVIERLVAHGRAEEIATGDLPEELTAARTSGDSLGLVDHVLPIRDVQRRYAAWALQQCNGHRGKTAERLDVDAKTLAKWLSEEAERLGRTG